MSDMTHYSSHDTIMAMQATWMLETDISHRGISIFCKANISSTVNFR